MRIALFPGSECSRPAIPRSFSSMRNPASRACATSRVTRPFSCDWDSGHRNLRSGDSPTRLCENSRLQAAPLPPRIPRFSRSGLQAWSKDAALLLCRALRTFAATYPTKFRQRRRHVGEPLDAAHRALGSTAREPAQHEMGAVSQNANNHRSDGKVLVTFFVRSFDRDESLLRGAQAGRLVRVLASPYRGAWQLFSD